MRPSVMLELIRSEDEDDECCDLRRLVHLCAFAGLDEDGMYKVLNKLMDDGLVYEPVLGVLKVV